LFTKAGNSGLDRGALVRYRERMEFAFFGQRLRAIREGTFIRHEPMGLRELARRSGLRPSTISQWESGLRWRDKLPPADDVQRLADALGIPFEQLTGVSDRPTPERALEVQRMPLADLLRRMGARPYRGWPIEDFVPATGPGPRTEHGFAPARPLAKRGETGEPVQQVLVVGDFLRELILPGDVVAFDTRQTPEANDVVVATRFPVETIVAFLRVRDDRRSLESPDGHTSIPLDPDIRILGPIVAVQRALWRLRPAAR